MKVSRLLAAVSLVSFGASLAVAQDSIRLQFEVVKDGATVARPEVSVTAGSTGTLEVAEVGNMAFTPTPRGSDGVAVAFDIRSGGKEFQPRLVISKDEAGTLSWTSDAGAHSFKVKVSWARRVPNVRVQPAAEILKNGL